MENAADSLKIAFGIFVFMIAFTVLFNMASLARYTAEVLITEADRTTYYNYYEKNSELVDAQGNRIVTLQEVVPTIYRYWAESYGVTIIDNGEIMARFDLQTERFCNNFGITTSSQKQMIINQINSYVLIPTIGQNSSILNDINDLQELFQKLYKQEPSIYHPRTFDCPWNSNNAGNAALVERIDSDLSRRKSIFCIWGRRYKCSRKSHSIY